MRLVMLATTLALLMSGCAGNLGQTTMPADQPVTGTAGGRGADLDMSRAARTLLEQGRDQRRAGEYAQASASLERALRIESDEPEVWLEMGWLRFDEGNFVQAEQMGRKAQSLAPAGSSAAAQASRLIADALSASD